MAATMENISQLERRINITLPSEEINGEVQNRLKRLARNVKMHGFRPGKVPLKVVAQQYEDQVRREVLGDALQKSFGEAVRAQNLKVAGYPRFEPAGAVSSASQVEFSATFEIYPDVVIGSLGNARVIRPVTTVSEAEVDKTISIMRKQRAKFERVARAAAIGDQATIDFVGKINGEEFDGGKGEAVATVLGEGRLLKDFENNVVGMETGASKTFELRFPEDYHGKELSGKTATFDVKLKQVAEAVLPPVDADFAKSLGVADGNLETMRREVRENLEREVKQRIGARVKDQIMQRTVGRVVMPWAEIGAPTRTEIVEIEPGNAQVFRGQQVTIKARVQGLAGDGKVTLVYTTADGQVVDRAVEMNLPTDSYQHQAVLPAGNGSLQQSLTYRIQAGDAVTKTYRLEVVAAPTIVVRGCRISLSVLYGPVDEARRTPGRSQGDRGDRGHDRGAGESGYSVGLRRFRMRPETRIADAREGQEAKATFRLALQDDRRTPEHACYHLVFKNEQGQQNPQPVRHQIEVTRDLPPEIQFVAPKQDELDLPLGGAVNLEIVANDPDFALRRVQLSATSGKEPLLDKRLLDETRPGQFGKKIRFEPLKLGLKVGDVVEYWAAAEDNKIRDPTAPKRPGGGFESFRPAHGPRRINSRETTGKATDSSRTTPTPGPAATMSIRATTARGPKRSRRQPARKKRATRKKRTRHEATAPDTEDNPPPRDKPAEQNPDQRADDQNDQPADNQGSQRPGGAGDKPNDKSGQPQGANPGVPADGSDDGEAIEQILKHRDEQRKTDPPAGTPRSQREEQKPGDSKQPADDQGADPDNGAAEPPKPDASQQPHDQKSGGEKGKKADQRNQQSQPSPKTSPNPSPEQRDKTPGEPGPKDSDAGEKGQGDNGKSDGDKGDSGQSGSDKGNDGKGQQPGKEGQQGQKGQKGQQGQKGKPSAQGQSDQAGDGGEEANDPQKTSPPGGKGSGKSTDAKPGDDDAPDEAASAGKDAPQGRGTPREKTRRQRRSKRDRPAVRCATGPAAVRREKVGRQTRHETGSAQRQVGRRRRKKRSCRSGRRRTIGPETGRRLASGPGC